MTVRAILWGTNYDNELVVGELYNPATDREHRDGSDFVQGPSGVEAAWITGRDYTLEADLRWIPDGDGLTQTPVSGGRGFQAFLDWARDKNTFRFVPDVAAPLFYVDGCYLVEPLKGFGAFENVKRSVPGFKIRNPTVDFHQALRGLMFEYAPGASLTDPVAAAFARATAATYRGDPLGLPAALGKSAASGVLRDRHYEGSLRTTLLEAARTQLVTQPENFGLWTVTGTPVLTAGQADPFGGTAAYLLADDSAAVAEYITLGVGFTGDGTKCVSFFIRQGASTTHRFRVVGAVTRHEVIVTWSGGVPSLSTATGSGTLFPVENWGGGWYRVLVGVDNVDDADSNTFFISPNNFSTTEQGSVYIFGANAWNAPFPSSYQGPSLGTRNADVLSWPFLHRPQAMFVYVDVVDRGTRDTPEARYLEIGAATSVPPRLILRQTGGGNTSWRHDNDSAAVEDVLTASTHAIGDRVEFLGIVDATGVVRLRKSVNGGADIVGTGSGALAFAAAFSDMKLWVGSVSDNVGYGAYRRLKVGPLTFAGQTVDTIAKARVA